MLERAKTKQFVGDKLQAPFFSGRFGSYTKITHFSKPGSEISTPAGNLKYPPRIQAALRAYTDNTPYPD